MTTTPHDTLTLAAIQPLRAAGFALHWLHAREKRPIGDKWSEAPVASLEDLRRTHRAGNNLGVRLGEVSKTDGGYLHVLDIDIRVPDLADEAWEALAELFPDVDPADLPCVASGSGGESRHLYFVSEKAFRSKKLAVSEGKHRTASGSWSYDWEVELFGTGKQVAMPPSIHPDTRKPYVWLREFDFDNLALGLSDWPTIPAADIEKLEVAEQSTFAFETREPLTFTPKQFERTLNDIDVSGLDYDDWIRLGQAIHHQTGGSAEGFNVWLEHTKRSSKFGKKSSPEAQTREMRRVKWKSFGKYRGRPVTMATVVEWAQEARVADLRDAFDDLDDATPAADAVETDFEDLLGGDTAPKSDLDLLGGDDEEDPLSALLAGGGDDWVSLLDLNEEGAIKPTLHNVELMVRNDPRLSGLPQLNEFTLEPVQRIAPGTKANRRANAAKQTRQLAGRVWQVKDALNGDLWSDDRDFAIRSILEAPKTQGGYGVKVTDRDLKASIVLAATDHSFHPVREYLERPTWDGVARVETLFHDYVGAPDDAYSRSVSRLMMVAAVTRIYEPGAKWDFAVILEGLQGKRKSTFIQTLGRSWFAELDGDFHDPKQMIELMQGAWIMEIPELSGFNRGDVRSIKAFISRQRDRARLAYAKRAGEFPRQCIFIGSTNDREYLKDDTGGRRFWPMLCCLDGEIDIDRLDVNVDQLWAEALTLYRAMRVAQPYGIPPLYLTDPEARATAARLQESRRVESADDGWAGRIADWLDLPINTGSLDEDTDEQGRPLYRDKTCLMELWFECLGNQGKYQTADGNMLARIMTKITGWTSPGTQHRFGKYGKQRVYLREG